MHALVVGPLAQVAMPIKVDHAQLALNMWRDSTQGGVANGVVAAKDDGKGTPSDDVAESARDLIEALLDVRGDNLDIASVNHNQGFVQIKATLGIVAIAQSGSPPNSRRPEARPWAVGGTAVQGHPDDDHILPPKLLHITKRRACSRRALTSAPSCC
jgi:hypothetical protein